jgi:hypothetical protein
VKVQRGVFHAANTSHVALLDGVEPSGTFHLWVITTDWRKKNLFPAH